VKATTILNSLLADLTPTMHTVRRQSLKALVTRLISGSHLSVTSLGRHIGSETTEKHQIKRSTRLCSNPHLHNEITAIYSSVAVRLIDQRAQPVILVDWSDLDPRKQPFLLRAAVAVDGRSLTLLEDVYPLSQKEKPMVHKLFMSRLKAILPPNCRPIIVIDTGFRVPWFKMIASLGWDFVGRVRNRTFCQSKTKPDWHSVKDLYHQARTTAKSLGPYQMCQRNPVDCQMVVYKQKNKGRKCIVVPIYWPKSI